MSSASVVEPHSTTTDSILVSSLRLNATVGNDRWAKTRPQPITLSLHLETSLADAGASDDVAHTIDYGQLTKALTSKVDGHAFGSLRELANAALHIPFDCPTAVAARIDVQAHNQFLRADALGVTLFRDKNNRRRDIDRMWMRGLKATCIIGVNPAEREWRQNVEVDVIFDDPGWIMPDWRGMHDKLIQTIETSSFLTLEAFATAVARTACFLPGAHRATIQARKPSALVGASASGVEITRDRDFFQR